MKQLGRLFTDHPASVDESYVEHFGVATGFGFKMIVGGLACMVHGVLPFLFVRTGSRCIGELHETMVNKRNRKSGAAAPLPDRTAA